MMAETCVSKFLSLLGLNLIIPFCPFTNGNISLGVLKVPLRRFGNESNIAWAASIASLLLLKMPTISVSCWPRFANFHSPFLIRDFCRSSSDGVTLVGEDTAEGKVVFCGLVWPGARSIPIERKKSKAIEEKSS